MTVHSRVAKPLVEAIRSVLTANALPGETAGFERESQREAAEFVAQAAAKRVASTSVILLQSTGGEAGHRRMRLVAINEDMPFLVDSVAAAVAGQGRAAIDHLADESRTVLILKADRISPVHRRVPLDVVMVKLPDGRLSLHAGLWTSGALRTNAEKVPVLRERLAKLDRELGFSPSSHAGKALSHAVSTLPHDLLISFNEQEVRAAALTAMSLADRPRPRLLLLPGALRRHLYAFVWLPREELTTARRKAIAAMLENVIEAPISSWSVELGEGELALIRFTMAIDPNADPPDAEALDAALVEMVRGWAPAVESELIAIAGASRATRLALSYVPSFPEGYKSRTSPDQAAADILRLGDLAGDDERAVRLCPSAHGRHELPLK